ncbi:MAG TPA: ATP-dependent DNA ligase [Candidatus Nanoarchaeia archaeon]|nr:ATP-dependent DNA ligase [Candidatus Nanoarchaeia archaeon]
MDFQELVELYEQLENTASGNQMREILSGFFKKVPAKEVRIVAYLTLGQISSGFTAINLGLADKLVLKAIARSSGKELPPIMKIMHQTGDVGLTAEETLHKKPRTLVPVEKLTITDLFENLQQIAQASGAGSQDLKCNLLISLLQRASAKGAKYITRIVLGTLRMGVGEMTVLDSLALAYTGEKKNKAVLETAYNICPDVGIIAETIVKKGLSGLEKMEIHLGRPIKMMLAQRVEALEDIPRKISGPLAVEGKYDGERVQAHKSKEGIVLFSRRLENITEQFPDLVDYFKKQITAKEFVLEAEIIAIDEQGKHQPFQLLMQRRRKHHVQEYVKKIPIQAKLFDLLYLDGKSLLQESYEQRYKLLKKIVIQSKHIALSDRLVNIELPQLKAFFEKMLQEGYEGVMIKSLSGEYQAGTRGWNWIKWKKEYVKDLGDTFDLVVVGAYHGKGRRSGLYGALLCAVYDQKEDAFKTICKLGTGLTDEVLAGLPEQLKKYKVDKKPVRVQVKKEMEPDLWFEPAIVVEVLAAEVTKSPFHTLGYALRFPRFIRIREDKTAEQTTTSKEIIDLIRS